MQQPSEYVRFWRDINKALWRSACAGRLPDPFIRAEIWRRVDHARVLEKSASIRLLRNKKPPCPIQQACSWIVENSARSEHGLFLPEQSALAPENAAIPAVWPKSYAGVSTDARPECMPQNPQKDHFNIFVQAFFYAAQAAKNVGLAPESFLFEFDFSKNRWAVVGTKETPFQMISVSFLYLMAPPKVWNALFEAIVHQHAPSRKMAERYLQSTHALQLIEIYGEFAASKRSDTYDLDAMFDQLNEQYFNGYIPKPMLAWTTRASYRKLGSYNFHWGIICLSKILNDPKIPEFAVRYVLYHEMLHIRHGLHDVAGRKVSHTPEFRADEARFPNFKEAEAVLQKLRDLSKPS